MRIEVQSAAYSASPQNATFTVKFIPETDVEEMQLPGLLLNRTFQSSGFKQSMGMLTGTFTISPQT